VDLCEAIGREARRYFDGADWDSAQSAAESCWEQLRLPGEPPWPAVRDVVRRAFEGMAADTAEAADVRER
jgi:hypothetical protein